MITSFEPSVHESTEAYLDFIATHRVGAGVCLPPLLQGCRVPRQELHDLCMCWGCQRSLRCSMRLQLTIWMERHEMQLNTISHSEQLYGNAELFSTVLCDDGEITCCTWAY